MKTATKLLPKTALALLFALIFAFTGFGGLSTARADGEGDNPPVLNVAPVNVLPQGNMELPITPSGFDGRPAIEGEIFWTGSSPEFFSKSTDAYEGDESIKIMHNPSPDFDDQRGITVEIPTNKLPADVAFYKVTFMAKRVGNGAILKVGPGWEHWNWQEKLFMYCRMPAFDNWVLMTYIIPKDPSNNLLFYIKLEQADCTTSDGMLIDDLRVEPYNPVAEGKTNVLVNPSMDGEWIDPDWFIEHWTMGGTGFIGIDGFWLSNSLKGLYNGVIGGVGAPADAFIKQDVVLEPNTAYDLSFYARKYEGAPDAFGVDDRLIFGITDNNGYTSEYDINPSVLGTEGFSKYAQIGARLQSDAATNYTFYFRYVSSVSTPIHILQIDEVYLAEASDIADLDVTADDIESDFYGREAVMLDVADESTLVEFNKDFLEGVTYNISIDVQKSVTNEFAIAAELIDGDEDVVAGGTSGRFQMTAETITFSYEHVEGAQPKLRLSADCDIVGAVVGFSNIRVEAELPELDKIEASASKTTLAVGETATIQVNAFYGDMDAMLLPANNFTATSSDNAIATVANGVITGHKGGTATITVSVNGEDDTINITVVKALTGITVSANNTELAIGGTATLTVTAVFDDETTQALTTGLTITSSNTAVATVDGSTVTAVGAGTTTITVTDGTFTDTITITVVRTLVSIEVTIDNDSIVVGGTATITVTATYDDQTTQTITTGFTTESGTTATATISGSTVTAVAAGTTTITVSYGGKQDTVDVTVTAPQPPQTDGCKSAASALAALVLALGAVAFAKRIKG